MMRIYLWLDVVQVGNMARLTFVTRCFFIETDPWEIVLQFFQILFRFDLESKSPITMDLCKPIKESENRHLRDFKRTCLLVRS